MSITLYPDTGYSADNTIYGDPIPILDADALYGYCLEQGIPTDWWYSKANTITLIAGFQPSEAYLLIDKIYIDGATAAVAESVLGKKKVIPALKFSERYDHKITLKDNFSQLPTDDPNYQAPTDIRGWVFHSARAIDGSNLAGDPRTAYLVKFVDRRFLFNQKPYWTWVPSETIGVDAIGYSISSKQYLSEDMSGSVTTPGEFPLLGADFSAFDWESTLEGIYNNAAAPFLENAQLPTGGSYPDEGPIDYFIHQRNAWEVFCECLHATGNEIFPKLDGTFEIKPIDAHFNVSESDLDPYINYVVENGHPIPDDKMIPAYVAVRMRLKPEPESDQEYVTNYYISNIFSTDSTVIDLGVGTPLLVSDATAYGGAVYTADPTIGGTWAHATMDTITTPCVSYLPWMPDTATAYWDYLYSYSRHIATKLIQSRLDNQVDATYGRFIPLNPSPQFEKVTFFFYKGSPATRFESLPSVVGVESLEFMPTPKQDRLVASDPTDTIPAELIDKIEDTTVEGTYDELLHQVVWGEIVTHGTSPDLDNKIRFYTTLGTGAAGPTGPAGPAGPAGPTYYADCGIDIDGGNNISVAVADLAGVGMQVDPSSLTTCSISPYPPQIANKGLEPASDNVANETVYIKVKPGDLYTAGGGLTEPTVAPLNDSATGGPVKIKIKPGDLVTSGGGLMEANDNVNAAAGPVKIKIRPIDLCGDGLTVQPGNQDDANGPVKIKVDNDAPGMIAINNITGITLDLVGSTLVVTLDYTVINVHGKTTATTAQFTDSVATTTCV